MEIKDEIIHEIEQQMLSVLTLAVCNSETANTWDNFHLYAGATNTFIAAISATLALASFSYSSLLSAALSIIAAILAGMSTFLNPTDKIKSHWKASIEYEHLYKKFRILRIDVLNQTTNISKANKKVGKLIEEYYAIKRDSPLNPNWAWRKGHESAIQLMKHQMSNLHINI